MTAFQIFLLFALGLVIGIIITQHRYETLITNIKRKIDQILTVAINEYAKLVKAHDIKGESEEKFVKTLAIKTGMRIDKKLKEE